MGVSFGASIAVVKGQKIETSPGIKNIVITAPNYNTEATPAPRGATRLLVAIITALPEVEVQTSLMVSIIGVRFVLTSLVMIVVEH